MKRDCSSHVTPEGLQDAAATRALFLVYQPKLDLRSGEITGVEALARWQHPTRGSISPANFISETEQCGFIDWFSEWAVTTATRQWSSWRTNGIDVDLAVNISALNLKDLSFPDLVSGICAAEGMLPERLILELTEGATLDPVQLMDTVARVRLKGIGISLDDFGTGYGSLVQLRGLPFTELKIDQCFVSDLLVSGDSRAITRGLIRMAHEIGLIVTAEGVEDGSTLQTLQAFGCDKAQGFLIGEPMRGELFPQWLRWWSSSDGRGPASQDHGLPDVSATG